jgi:hypothetical protein
MFQQKESSNPMALTGNNLKRPAPGGIFASNGAAYQFGGAPANSPNTSGVNSFRHI